MEKPLMLAEVARTKCVVFLSGQRPRTCGDDLVSGWDNYLASKLDPAKFHLVPSSYGRSSALVKIRNSDLVIFHPSFKGSAWQADKDVIALQELGMAMALDKLIITFQKHPLPEDLQMLRGATGNTLKGVVDAIESIGGEILARKARHTRNT